MIGDIGGLNDALLLIFQFVVSVYNGSAFHVHAVTKLFTVNKDAFRSKYRAQIFQADNRNNAMFENILT